MACFTSGRLRIARLADAVKPKKKGVLMVKNIYKKIFTFTGAACLVIGFQNCGTDLRPMQNAIESQSLFDAALSSTKSRLPSLLSDENFILHKKQTFTQVENSTKFSEASSVILKVDKNAAGLIYSFQAEAELDQSELFISNGKIRAIHKTDVNNYTYIEATLPSLPEPFEQTIIAAAFGTEPEEISLQINGIIQNGSIQKVGTPYASSFLLKQVYTASALDTDGEVIVFSKVLTPLDLNVMSRYIALNSKVAYAAFDPALIRSTGGNQGGGGSATPQFLAAKNIIDSKCLACHSSSNNGDFRNLNQNQFLQKNLVSARNPAGSKIYYRLSGATSGPGPANMPQGSDLTSTEVQIIADWINSI